MFREDSPALELRGLTNGEYATLVSTRTAIEAKVLVTERIRPIRLRDGQVVHQIGMPYHWSYSGISTGDGANDLLGIVLDPNTHIQEDKVSTADIRPGRRPRGGEVRVPGEHGERLAVAQDRHGLLADRHVLVPLRVPLAADPAQLERPVQLRPAAARHPGADDVVRSLGAIYG